MKYSNFVEWCRGAIPYKSANLKMMVDDNRTFRNYAVISRNKS